MMHENRPETDTQLIFYVVYGVVLLVFFDYNGYSNQAVKHYYDSVSGDLQHGPLLDLFKTTHPI